MIDELKEELGLKEETTNQKSEYTVTFLYNGAVFGTQTVKAGAVHRNHLLCRRQAEAGIMTSQSL